MGNSELRYKYEYWTNNGFDCTVSLKQYTLVADGPHFEYVTPSILADKAFAPPTLNRKHPSDRTYFPTKEEALEAFRKKTRDEIKGLEIQLAFAKRALDLVDGQKPQDSFR